MATVQSFQRTPCDMYISRLIVFLLFIDLRKCSGYISIPARLFGALRRPSPQHQKIAWSSPRNKDIDAEDILLDDQSTKPFFSRGNEDDYEDIAAGQTVQSLSRFGLSYQFIGDAMAEMGVECPIDMEAKIGSYMTGWQIDRLMTSVTSLDPYTTNSDYSIYDMTEHAQYFDLTPKKVKYMCEREKINLPFGMGTCLHHTLEERFVDAVKSGMYDKYQDDTYVPNYPDLDGIVEAMGQLTQQIKPNS